MKAVVIGAAGFVGRAVLARFAGEHQVRAFDQSPAAWDTYRHLDGEHPDGRFLSSEVRSKEGDLYGITKRLQEEVCRQYHEAHGVRVIIFRPCSIGDSRLGISRQGRPARGGISWVCRHDLAQACHLALENDAVDFAILHTASHPEADKHCNVALSRELLGLEYRGHFPA